MDIHVWSIAALRERFHYLLAKSALTEPEARGIRQFLERLEEDEWRD